MTTLQYYFVTNAELEHVIFNKYTIANGVIVNKQTRKVVSYRKNITGYNICTVRDDGGVKRTIRVARAIASTIIGSPPTVGHTVDHIDRNPDNDMIDNIRWLCKSKQRDNQDRQKTLKSAFVVIKDGENKTVKEWEDYLKDHKNHMGRAYTEKMISHYAQKKRHGFAYIEYPNLPGEVWKKIAWSENSKGRWEISNMNRIKYITSYAENVLTGERLDLVSGYPKISINGRNWLCHILSFMTFFPEKYAAKEHTEAILHEDDDRLDFRPHKLRLGTFTDNRADAYNNGKHDGTKSERIKCASYIDGVLETEYISQSDAERYLKSLGNAKASIGNICKALNPKYKSNFAYGRTWKLVE